MTIAVDFDGVIHGYSKGWQKGEIYDAPVPGTKAAMDYLKSQGHTLLIYSTRSNKIYAKGRQHVPDQDAAIKAYLDEHKIPYTKIWKLGKPMADVYLDDRAVQFTGDWQQAVVQINAFKPWNR